MCLLLNLQFNPEDPNESLKAIFKRIKLRIKSLIDFDGDFPLRENLDVEELKLESPYQEISKDVRQRLLFLFELKPSVDYQSKVIKIDSQQIKKRIQILNKQLSQVSLALQEDQNSQHKFTESSINGDDDSEDLLPLGVQRSQSEFVGI